MLKKIIVDGQECEISIIGLCHKGDSGNYKLNFGKKINFDLQTMSEELKKTFEIDKFHKLFLIIKKGPVSISIAKHGKIMLEKVNPDKPEVAFALAEMVLKTIPGYEGTVESH